MQVFFVIILELHILILTQFITLFFILSECVALQDPYCAWDKIAGRCKATEGRLLDANNYYQSVSNGVHASCPLSKFSLFERPYISGTFME